jgi:DNA polymerase V
MTPDHLDISLDQLLNIRAPGTYLVKVEGDSREGAGIFCGDLLIVDKGIDAKAGQVIIGAVNQQPLVKYLAFVSCHTVLRSANPNTPPLHHGRRRLRYLARGNGQHPRSREELTMLLKEREVEIRNDLTDIAARRQGTLGD